MFLPFVSYILVLTASAALIAFPTGTAPPADFWHIAMAGLLPWALGWLVGLAPHTWMGGRSPMRLTRRRGAMLLLWLAAAGLSPLVSGVAALLAPLPGGAELVLIVLLLHYWVADSLALHPPHMLGTVKAPGAWGRFARALRVPLPLLILVGAGFAISGAVDTALEQWELSDPSRFWWGLAWPTLLYLGCGVVGMPVLVRLCWGLRPLASPRVQQAAQEELAAGGNRVTRVLAWPDDVTGFKTAGVIGMVPGFRYLLFSNDLAQAMTLEEIRSVVAHEAAHLKHRHLWYFLASIFAALLLIQVLWRMVVVGGLWLHVTIPDWSVGVVELVLLLGFLRFGWGYLSRNFERQADGHALRRAGLDAFQNAIAKVAVLNGIRMDQDNWHHHGIGQRIAYLRGAAADPRTLERQDRRVIRLKVACLLFLGLGLGAQWAVSAAPLLENAAEGYWEQQIEQAGVPGPEHLTALQELAIKAYRRKDLTHAERYFRMILAVTPGDSQTQNNLAWLLVTRPDEDAQSLQEGLKLAERASAALQSAYVWDTLAEAYFRSHQYERARTAALQALSLAESGRGRGEATLKYYRDRVLLVSQPIRGA
jgi:Zn-dependent protease with chaperone function